MLRFNHMPKPKIKQTVRSGWAEVVADSEAEVERAKRKIERLKGVILLARQKLADGEPFPSTK